VFSSVIGHEHLKSKLSAMFQKEDQTGTFLFSGPPSVGKRTVAFDASKYILCKESGDDECSCYSCERFGKDHPDFFCMGSKDRIKTADADLFLDFVSTRPFLSNRKVAVIDNAETATWEAANKLLKIIEEPYKDFSFFVISSDPGSVLPTIVSRCIKYNFERLSQGDLINIIWKKMGFELPKAQILAWIGSGSPIDIFSNAGSYLSLRDHAVEFVSGLKRTNLIDSMDYIDKIPKKDLPIFSDMILMVMTDLLLIKNGIEDIANSDARESLKKLSEKFNGRALAGATSFFSQAKKYSSLNVNMNMVLKNILIKSYPLFAAEVVA